MQFFSTRDRNRVVSASQAIAQGLSDEGGLFVPQSFRRWVSKRSVGWNTPKWQRPSWGST